MSYRSSPVLRAGQGLCIGVACALILGCANVLTAASNKSFNFSRTLERSTTDALFQVRGEGYTYPSPNIVVVEADDETIPNYSWPLPRRIYARLINHLTKAGAKTIAFDVMFPTSSNSPADDKALIDATAASGHVVHSVSFRLGSGEDVDSSVVGLKGNAGSILARFRMQQLNASVPETVWGSATLLGLQKGAVGLGHVNAPPEFDGVLRRIPHILHYQGGKNSGFYPSLALATAANFLDVQPDQIQVKDNEIVLPAPSGTRHIPLDAEGKTFVNWIGQHLSYQTFSFQRVLKNQVPDSFFKGKIVLIGVTVAGSFERHATPFSSVQPAVDLQANALDDILMQRPLRNAPNWLWVAMILLFSSLVGALTLSTKAKVSGLMTLALAVALWFVALGLLSHANYLLPIATPMLTSFLAWGVGVTYRQLRESQQLRLAEERYTLAVRGANDGLWDWDLQANEVYYSPRWKAMLGYRDEEIGAGIEEWYSRVHPDDLGCMQAQLNAHLDGGVAHFESQHRMKHRDGAWIWVLVRGLRVCDASGKPSRMAGSQGDISLQVESREQLERNAFYDSLTGLPNRALFMDLLERAVAKSRRNEAYRFAVLFLDIDRFKLINDSLGHACGDELLVSVARRVKLCLRPGDTAARLSGDEFTILLEEVDDIGSATRIAEQIQNALAEPFALANQEIFSTASIGIALSSNSYYHGDDLLRDADTAMYRAKSMGRARQAVFDEAMHAHSLALLRLETDLRRALERQDLLVYYQPLVRLETGEISGFEALVRWQHPERGMVSPGEFIGLAEETGLIIPIDHLVLREACVQLCRWHTLFPEKELTVSVNLSSKQFAQTDLVTQVQRTLTDTGLPPRYLKLEITESVLMDNPDIAAALLHQLRELGIRLSIDDFGTGYSSLSYLHRFPLDTLKVDQSFVKRIEPNGENSEIVRTIVTLARNLNMDVVAEGVETAEQLALLRDIACDYGQGYYFAKPLHLTDAEALLTKGTRWSPTVKIASETASEVLESAVMS